MLFALVNDNQIVGITEADDESHFDQERHRYQQVINIDSIVPAPQVGWHFDGVTFFKYFPNISARQIRLALLGAGLDLTIIQAALDSLPEPTRSYAIVSWEYSVEFERRNPLVANVAMALGWTEENLDGLWEVAMSL